MQRAFTLVELLVVITIIVVLLALLVPALDQAIYQAGLAVCSARQDAIMTGASLYAMENNRRYFHRPGITAGDVWWRTFTLREPPLPGRRGQTALNDYDDRIITRDHIPLEAFKDPLAGNVDIGTGTEDDVTILASYNLLYSFQYHAQGGGRRDPGLFRIGDQLAWNSYRFNILASDLQYYHRAATVINLSHPDRDDTVGLKNAQNEDTSVNAIYGRYTYTLYGRNGSGNFAHGSVDLNYGYQDGSVRRTNDLPSPGESRVMNLVMPTDYPAVRLPFIAAGGFDENQAGQVWLPR